jgi:hypothetical protein
MSAYTNLEMELDRLQDDYEIALTEIDRLNDDNLDLIAENEKLTAVVTAVREAVFPGGVKR